MNEVICLYSCNNLFITFLLTVCFDIILGTLKAFNMDTVNSDINKTGITKHVAIILFVMFMIYLFKPLEIEEFSSIFIMFYIASYLLSIIENVTLLGVPVPSWVKKHFSTLKEMGDKNEVKRNEKY